ncbi:MAG: hypothetical protein M1832_000079 [Thelocarpon impressellum]|nr:MAG: hypothetical protein M1832_000079 [Thelocarpon impressellum]
MSIPNAREPVPPALPPPKQIDCLDDGAGPAVDLGWWLGNNERFGGRSSFGSVDPESSLFGGQGRREHRGDARRPDAARRGSSTSTIRSPTADDGRPHALRHPDEGYASLSGSGYVGQKSESAFLPPAPAIVFRLCAAKEMSLLTRSSRLQGEESQTHAFLQRSVQAYDNSLLQKIDSARSDPTSRNPNTPPRNFRPSAFRVGAPDAAPNARLPFDQRRSPNQLNPLSLPTGPSRSWSDASDVAVSPLQQPSDSPSQFTEYRNVRRETGSVSSFTTEPDQYMSGPDGPVRRSGSTSLLGSCDDASSVASRSNRGSYDQGIFQDPDSDFQMEETGLRHLNLEDHPGKRDAYSPWSKAGQKRRASSPPRDPEGEPPLASAGGGAGHRSAERKSSVPRLNCGGGSVSSASSLPRNGSLTSSAGLSLAASSTTSMSSYERLSPRGTSPCSELDPAQDSPYVASSSLRPSPRGSISRAHQRTPSESKGALPSRKPSLDETAPAKAHGSPRFYICECCPKKPKKFDNHTELRTHEMEKQYTCQYCHNRFKNKNEAERHQNSLHLRRHSWSCNALSGVEAAFHPSPHKPSLADICGYCGEDFANPANWDARVEHLTALHKFGECNQGKKFFRADHFRQHLKHSHAGTSGKWTNMLENACMKDEPLPERVNSVSEGVGRIDEEREEA